ncbi:hypothetical protein KW787_00870 [Candidatus Pacearchaeota archaeon]|nr:hypothetical protein [Candidatus Pacearchaeota archaeon]
MSRFLVILLMGIVMLGFVSAQYDTSSSTDASIDSGSDTGQSFVDNTAASDNGSTDSGASTMFDASTSNGSDNSSSIFESPFSDNTSNSTSSENASNTTVIIGNGSENGTGNTTNTSTGAIQIVNNVNGQSTIIVGNVAADTDLDVSSYNSGGGTQLLQVAGDNGTSFIILPDAAVNAVESNTSSVVCDVNCTIELKEQNYDGQPKVVYEVGTQKPAKLFGLFSTTMNVGVDVDAQTGQVLDVNKPWWAFLAVESSNNSNVSTNQETNTGNENAASNSQNSQSSDNSSNSDNSNTGNSVDNSGSDNSGSSSGSQSSGY